MELRGSLVGASSPLCKRRAFRGSLSWTFFGEAWASLSQLLRLHSRGPWAAVEPACTAPRQQQAAPRISEVLLPPEHSSIDTTCSVYGRYITCRKSMQTSFWHNMSFSCSATDFGSSFTAGPFSAGAAPFFFFAIAGSTNSVGYTQPR